MDDNNINVSKAKNIVLAPGIHYVLAAAFESFRDEYTPEAFAETIATDKIIRERIKAKNTNVFIAKNGFEIIGTVAAQIKTPDELYLESMAVLPGFSRKGVGQAILDAVEADAKERNFKSIVLETYEPLKAAIALYEKNGYKRTGEERDYYGIRVFTLRKEL